MDHPLVPGDTSAIERGPWHYGADYVSVFFLGEPSKLARLIPSPFKVGDGTCIGYVCEIVSVSDAGEEMVSSQPDRTIYQEAAIGVSCSFEGKAGVYFPVMWVSTEWALLRGLLNGYQKRLADKIAITKLHQLNPGLRPLGPGVSESGFCVKGGERTLSVAVDVRKSGTPQDLTSFGSTFGMRRFPQTEASQGSVWEAVEVLKTNSRASDVWVGDGRIKTSLEVGEPEVTLGAVYKSGFTISGSKVLTKM